MHILLHILRHTRRYYAHLVLNVRISIVYFLLFIKHFQYFTELFLLLYRYVKRPLTKNILKKGRIDRCHGNETRAFFLFYNICYNRSDTTHGFNVRKLNKIELYNINIVALEFRVQKY